VCVRAGLAKAITLIESELPSDKPFADALLGKCIPCSEGAIFIGVTGVPGVGKSTLLNVMGMELIHAGHRVAVLAIDPSSARTKGSIMGDKTRMDELSQHPNAFVRPSPTSGILGGVSRRTREACILCAAAGYDHIFIETVGVGQNELEIDQLADITLLLLLAGAGDELQGIKRGIMEAADVMAINKVDGENLRTGSQAAAQLRNALALLPPRDSGSRAQVFTCSALEKEQVQALTDHLQLLHANLHEKGVIAARRKKRMVNWMAQRIHDSLLAQLNNVKVREHITEIEQHVFAGQLNPINAADQVLEFMRTNPEIPRAEPE